jgi:ribosomal protein S18 acetylase RimI-like enzyme
MSPREPNDTSSGEIRRASAGDAPAVARLLHDFQLEFNEPSPGVEVLTERYERMLGRGEMIVLLAGTSVREEPIGFAQLRFRPWVYSDGLHAYLEELYVAPESRGDGVGRVLLEEAIETARAEGATHMELGTSESDTAARALYESLGFTNREGSPDGPVMFFYEREL